MKKLIHLLITKSAHLFIATSTHLLITASAHLLITTSAFSQSPEKMTYQAVVRDASGVLLSNQNVGIRIQILQGSESGAAVYVETHTRTTNANGLVTLEIGGGTIVLGSFPGINWANGPYFLKTEIDPAGGTSYSIIGTTQLLSVPYALHAKSAAAATETDPAFSASAASGITGTNITNWNSAYGWGNHALAGYIPGSRTLTINGTAYDLTANRSWSVGTVTSVGLSLPAIFSVTGSPVTGSGTLSATLASQSANLVLASPNGSTGTPAFRALVSADIPNLDWSKITTGKPTTLAGYGITDGVNTTGNQTIAGKKTFTGTITVPSPVNAKDAATKAYVDSLISIIQLIQFGVNDVDGNRYKVIMIGNQLWMAENLRTTKYNDGEDIAHITGSWGDFSFGAYCWYDHSVANKYTYGALYNWHAVNTGKLCPAGWHVPTYADWTTLENYLIANGFNYDGSPTGNKYAKALASTSGWFPSTNAGAVGNADYPLKRNATGFTALPGGYCISSFNGIGVNGYWWLATGPDRTYSWCINIYHQYSYVMGYYDGPWYGYSVRCVKD